MRHAVYHVHESVWTRSYIEVFAMNQLPSADALLFAQRTKALQGPLRANHFSLLVCCLSP